MLKFVGYLLVVTNTVHVDKQKLVRLLSGTSVFILYLRFPYSESLTMDAQGLPWQMSTVAQLSPSQYILSQLNPLALSVVQAHPEYLPTGLCSF